MKEDAASGGGVGVLVGIMFVLLLLLGGAGFYFVVERQKLVAVEQARVAERDAVMLAQVAHGQKALADAEEKLANAREELAAGRSADNGQSPADGGPPAALGDVTVEIKSVLRAQQEAWNRRDVDAFVEHYWKSDDVTFSSGGKTTRGWEEMVRGYRERYPTPEAMGRLTFGELEITRLGDAAALALGEWRLERESEPLSGNFSLVFRKLNGRWVIVHDHTSRVVE
jgi:ketosteroid isomerase-like protein